MQTYCQLQVAILNAVMADFFPENKNKNTQLIKNQHLDFQNSFTG
jgi:hypothetical protein